LSTASPKTPKLGYFRNAFIIKTPQSLNREIQEEKEKLQQQALQYREAIQKTVADSTEVARGHGKRLMLGAGVAVGTFLVWQFMSGGDRKKTVHTTTDAGAERVVSVQKGKSGLRTMIEKQLASWFTAWFKKELVKWLEKALKQYQERKATAASAEESSPHTSEKNQE
jgi:hypothetical protein